MRRDTAILLLYFIFYNLTLTNMTLQLLAPVVLRVTGINTNSSCNMKLFPSVFLELVLLSLQCSIHIINGRQDCFVYILNFMLFGVQSRR